MWNITPQKENLFVPSDMDEYQFNGYQQLEGRVGFYDRVLTEAMLPIVYAHRNSDMLLRLLRGEKVDDLYMSYNQIRQQMYQSISSAGLLEKLGMTINSMLGVMQGAGIAAIGALAKIINFSATGLVSSVNWGIRHLYNEYNNAVTELLHAIGVTDEDTYKYYKGRVKEREIEIDRKLQEEIEIMNNANYGFIGTPILGAMMLIGVNPFKRKVTYVDRNGETKTATVNAWNMHEEINRMKQAGMEIVKIQENPSLLEKWVTIGVSVADFFDPISNMAFGKVAKVVQPVNKAVLGTVGRVVANNGVAKYIANSAIGQTIGGKIQQLEGQLGVAMTGINRGFAKLFAPLMRRYNSRIELVKRMTEGSEEYIVNGTGVVADMINNAPEELEKILGKNAISSLQSSREEFMSRVEKRIAEGMSPEEAVNATRSEWRKAQAIALFTQTGLPISREIVEALQKEGLTPEQAHKIIQDAKGAPLTETESEAIAMLHSTGLIKELTNIDELVKIADQYGFSRPLLNLLAHKDGANLEKVRRILEDEEDFSNPEMLEQKHNIYVSDEVKQKIDATLPMYKKEVRQKIALALSVLENTSNPAERKAISDYITLHLVKNGASLTRLQKILKGKVDDNLWNDLMSSLEEVRNAELDTPDAATKTLEALKKGDAVEIEPIRRIADMIERSKRFGLGENVKSMFDCGRGGFLLSVIANISSTFGDNAMPRMRPTGSMLDEEIAIRSALFDELHAKGYTLDDITDTELRQWLAGEVTYTQPVTAKTNADAEKLILSIMEHAGIDRTFVNTALDFQETMKRGVVNIVEDAVGRTLSAEEVDAILKTPQDMRELFTQLAQRLEAANRPEDAYRIKDLLDKQADFNTLTEALYGGELFSNLGRQVFGDPYSIVDNYLKPINMIYYLGKDYAIRQGRHIMLSALNEFSNKIYGEQSMLSDSPSLLHTVRIEGVSPAVDGKYTTPYIANVLRGLVDDSTVWKGWLSFLNTMVKHSAVVWQPMALVRDAISNMAAVVIGMGWAPQSLYKLGLYYWKAFHAIRNHNEDFLRMAEQTPSVWGATVHASELQNELIERINSGSATNRMLWVISNMRIFRNMQALRGWSEAVGKMAMYYAVEDVIKSKSPAQIAKLAEDYGIDTRLLQQNANDLAVLVAEKYMLDYHDVTPAVRFLRRYLGIFPFITYESKMFSVLMGDLLSGRRLHSLLYAVRGVQSAQRMLNLTTGERDDPDTLLNEEEYYVKAMRQMLPERLKRDPFTLVYRDAQGDVNAISLSYYLPFGVLLPIQRILNKPDSVETYMREAKERLGGFLVPAFEVLINTDLYSGKPIYDKDEPMSYQMRKIFAHIGKEMMPLVPRSLSDMMLRNALEIPRSDEEIQKAVSVQAEEDPIKKFFGIYQIQVNEAIDRAYRSKIRKSNELLKTAMQRYDELMRLGKPNEAISVYRFYVREANKIRTEAEEMSFAGNYLLGRDVAPSYWALPDIGFNPMTDYEPEIEYMRELYQFLRENGELPQNTTKEQIMDYLIQVAENAMRAQIGVIGWMNLETQRLNEQGIASREMYHNYVRSQREAQTTIPLPPPAMPLNYEPTVPTIITSYRPANPLPNVSWNNYEVYKSSATVMREALKAYQRVQPIPPPSVGGDMQSNAGRPLSGEVM